MVLRVKIEIKIFEVLNDGALEFFIFLKRS